MADMKSVLKRVWKAATGALIALSAVLGFVSDAFGVREGVCGLGPVQPICQRAGLVHPQPAPVDPAAIRARLIKSIEGTWRRPDGSCEKPLVFKVYTDATGVTRIHLSGPNAFESTGQVVAADGGVIVSQDSVSGDYWKYAPNGDLMNATDPKRTPTPLVRCPAHP